MKNISFLFLWAFVVFLTIQSCRHYPADIIPLPNDTTNNDTSNVKKHPCSADTVYYARDIQPLFNAYCIGAGCHNPPSPKEELNLTSYSTALSSGKIIPFNGAGSKVYKSMNGTGGDIMPPTGKLSADKIALMKKWMDQGAKDLWCDDMVGPCDTAAVKYSTTIDPIFTNNCAGCHGTSGGITLTNYAGVKTVVTNGKLWNAINHLSGVTKAMPNSTNKLSACNLRQIKIWIDAGSPQN